MRALAVARGVDVRSARQNESGKRRQHTRGVDVLEWWRDDHGAPAGTIERVGVAAGKRDCPGRPRRHTAWLQLARRGCDERSWRARRGHAPIMACMPRGCAASATGTDRRTPQGKEQRMSGQTTPSGETDAEEQRGANKAHDAGRGPTEEEAAAADKNKVDEKTREGYDEMLERGAHQKGEGKPGV